MQRIENAQVKEKRVFLRADFDVPQDGAGNIVDDTRIRQILPTLELLSSRGASIIIGSHAGKPETASRFSLAPAAAMLEKISGIKVEFVADTFQGKLKEKALATPGGQITVLENLLQQKGEEKNEKEFAKKLGELADLYVNDSLGASRFPYASIVGLPSLLPSYGGLSLYNEVSILQSFLSGQNRPVVLILGGLGLDRKLKFLKKIMPLLDHVLIGGGLGYTFLKGRAIPVGSSLVEAGLEVEAFQIIERAELEETDFVLPIDHVVAEQFSKSAKTKVVGHNGIPERWMALDIGPKTVSKFEKIIKSAGSVLWYGPMGAIEFDKFAEGTEAIAKAVAKSKARTIVTGETCLRFIHTMDLTDRVHSSPSGEAIVDVLMGVPLPGLQALTDS